jgi:hypothetical protein
MMRDLIVLVADKTMETAMQSILERHRSLTIRKISNSVIRHPQHDPGCAKYGVAFLSHFADQYRHALLIFDHEGSGKEQTDRCTLQQELNSAFYESPWNERARAVVISPELETWIWSDSPHVDATIRWRDQPKPLRDWMLDQGWLREGAIKPERPKEAFEAALRHARTPRSASLYRQIAEKVSLLRCRDPAFLDLKATLREWFGR